MDDALESEPQTSKKKCRRIKLSYKNSAEKQLILKLLWLVSRRDRCQEMTNGKMI